VRWLDIIQGKGKVTTASVSVLLSKMGCEYSEKVESECGIQSIAGLPLAKSVSFRRWGRIGILQTQLALAQMTAPVTHLILASQACEGA
jgi:hypothetical protein